MTDIAERTLTEIVNPRQAAPRRKRSRVSRSEWIAGGVLAILIAISLFPYIFMLLTSTKSNEQFIESYWVPTWPLHLENYASAWNQIWPYFLSTIIVAAASIVGVLVLATSAAFTFARYEFVGRGALFGLLAALMMVPSIVSLIPLFVLMKDLGILNSYLVLVLPQVAGGVVIATVLIRTFVMGLPPELFEAAKVDGAGGFRQYWNIMLPLARPVIGTVCLLIVINVWNEFFWPLLTITDDSLRTIPVGLAYFQGQNVTEWGPLFAGYTIASVPLLVIFSMVSKHFLAGIQGGLPAGGGK